METDQKANQPAYLYLQNKQSELNLFNLRLSDLSAQLFVNVPITYIFQTMGSKSSTLCAQDNFSKSKIVHSDQFISYAVCHMKGWRDFMEDATIHINNFPTKNHYLFGIFDGHGGPEVAQYVQRHFSIELYLNPLFKTKEYVPSLIETFNKMDHIMQSEAGRKQIDSIIRHNISIDNRYDFLGEQYAGCTANVCLITDKDIYVANAGDSRCVASCRGITIPLSFDHKPQDKSEYERIRTAGGYVSHGRVNQSLNISRSLGDLQFKKNKSLKASQQMVTSTPDVLKCSRQGIEFILLGCDGIWQRKSNEVMVEWIRERVRLGSNPVDILQQLLDQQLAQNEQQYYGTDNMSAILIVFK